MGFFLFQMCGRTNSHTTTASSSETCPLCLAEQARREHSVRHPASSVVVSTKPFPAVFWEHLPGSWKINETAICEFLHLHPKLGLFLHFFECYIIASPVQILLISCAEKNVERVEGRFRILSSEKEPSRKCRLLPVKRNETVKGLHLRIFDAALFCWLLLGISNLEKHCQLLKPSPMQKKNVWWNIEYVLSIIDKIYKLHYIIYR